MVRFSCHAAVKSSDDMRATSTFSTLFSCIAHTRLVNVYMRALITQGASLCIDQQGGSAVRQWYALAAQTHDALAGTAGRCEGAWRTAARGR